MGEKRREEEGRGEKGEKRIKGERRGSKGREEKRI